MSSSRLRYTEGPGRRRMCADCNHPIIEHEIVDRSKGGAFAVLRCPEDGCGCEGYASGDLGVWFIPREGPAPSKSSA